MAEILISLTIIGVIAAITLPSLQANINEKTWKIQKKALYSRLSQALEMLPSLNGYGVVFENGSINETATANMTTQAFITEGLSKVLKIDTVCDYNNLKNCGFHDKIKKFNNSSLTIPNNISSLVWPYGSGNVPNPYGAWKVSGFLTPNGESILVYYNNRCISDDFDYSQTHVSTDLVANTHPYMCANFIFDLNGRKGPNKVGKDIGVITAFYATSHQVVMPEFYPKTSGYVKYEDAKNICRKLGSEYRLPKLEELMSLYINKQLYISDTDYNSGSKRYWASKDFSEDRAWSLYVSTGYGQRAALKKSNTFLLHCARK